MKYRFLFYFLVVSGVAYGAENVENEPSQLSLWYQNVPWNTKRNTWLMDEIINVEWVDESKQYVSKPCDGSVLSYIEEASLKEIDTINKYGKTALHMAIEYDKKSVVHALLSRGASMMIADVYGKYALQYIRTEGMRTLVETILKERLRKKI